MRPVFRSESKMKIFAFLILCFASVALAADFKTIDGKEYKNVTVSRVEPDGIVLITSSGISKVYFKRFKSSKKNYDGNWPKKRRETSRTRVAPLLLSSLNAVSQSK